MSLQRFFTRSTFGRFALFMMAGLLCASLSARPLLAAPDKDAAASDQKTSAKEEKAKTDKTADASSEKAADRDALTDKEKAKLEAEEKAKQEAEERARQDAEAATAKLQAEAEAAQQKSESTASDDAVWEEAFKQNQDELNAMEIEIDGLAGGLKAIINPLRKSLPGMEEAAQRLFSLAGTHKLDPIMLESIDQRGAKRGQGQNRRAGADEEKPPSPSGERQQGKAESRSAADVEKHQPHREQTHQDGSAADA